MNNPHYQRAFILRQQHRHADAADEFRKVLAADPHDAMAHAMLALCHIDLNQDKEATAEAKQAVGLAPDLPLAHFALGYALLKRNWLDEAQAAAREAIRLDAYDPDHFALLAAIEFDRRNWPAALEQAENALSIDPDHSWSVNLRAMALRQLGRRDEATATLGDALSRDPESAIAHANQGWSMLHAGDNKQAMVHFREALRLDPNLAWAKSGMVESLKAGFLPYRLLLKFFLWMSRLSSGAQWGVIIGAYVASRVLRQIARNNPAVAPFVWPILIAYLVFVAMTWLASPLLNLLLRLHRYGRYALSRDEVVLSNWIGGLLGLCILCVAAGAMLRSEACIRLGLVSGFLVIPMASAYACEKGWPRNVMFAAAGVLATLGLVSIALFISADQTPRPGGGAVAAQGLGLIFILGILACSLGVNFLRNVKPRG